jgi:hypothetical protein
VWHGQSPVAEGCYDGDPWTGRHNAWLRRQRFTNSLTQSTFEGYYDAMLATTARRDRLDAQIGNRGGLAGPFTGWQPT